jgi:hypothetical protein
MPSLNLVEPSSLEESIRRARTLDDQYGFRQRFRESSVEELIATFNSGVGVHAWVSARAAQLVALRDALDREAATRAGMAALPVFRFPTKQHSLLLTLLIEYFSRR